MATFIGKSYTKTTLTKHLLQIAEPMQSNISSAEHYLNQWPHWELNLTESPTVEKKLHGSINNQSYLISNNNRYWIIRIHHHNPLYSANRQQEHQTQYAVNQLNAAPKIVYQHPEGDYRISEYIEGRTLSELAAITESQTELLCQTIKRLHQINIDIPAFSYSDCIEKYWQAINNKVLITNTNAIGEYQHVLAMCKDYQQHYGQHRVLCHNDLNTSNILLTNASRGEQARFIIIDWEFSGGGIASMDFADLATEVNIDIHRISELSNISVEELFIAQEIYRYTCKIYNHASELNNLTR